MLPSALRASALSSAVLVTLSSSPAMAQLRAFGEAEGYGAAATGGRAATSVYHVTNLNDSGAGSLRDAVSGSNRIIVFDVAGEIKLSSAISCQSNLTIAGQTAPGEGITITGAQALGFTSRTNDIVRYVRMRPGDASSASDNGMSMTKTGTAILDHVSIEFGKYNNIDAVADTADLPRITIQNSIIADPISTGTDTRGQGFGAHLEAVNGFYTLSNNLWANSHSRNPLAKVNDQFKNNIEYNNEIGYLTSGTSTAFKHDLVNNAFIAGPGLHLQQRLRPAFHAGQVLRGRQCAGREQEWAIRPDDQQSIGHQSELRHAVPRQHAVAADAERERRVHLRTRPRRRIDGA